jgi:hypothetical protein
MERLMGLSEICLILSVAFGIAGAWVGRLVGPAVALFALSFLIK